METSAKPLGFILRDADLISESQIKVALRDLHFCDEFRIGEILVLRGWLKQETADFFAEQWCNLVNRPEKEALGYYLRSAALLDDFQIGTILREQERLGVRFGAIAVLKGWVKPKTIDFFLENLAPQERLNSPFKGENSQLDTSQTAKLLTTAAFIAKPQITASTQPKEDYDLAEALITSLQIIQVTDSEEEYDLAEALNKKLPW